ncbi:unnamed protein product [Linum trigynum]|uniref:Uncharacterized protein n=1 Tax=Linum trigynum TaxID=586398 RepID=A0AAV2DG76_9ROSI
MSAFVQINTGNLDISSTDVWRMMSAFVQINTGNLDISSTIKNWRDRHPNNAKEWCSSVFLHAYCWCMWLERNSRIFRGHKELPNVVCIRIARPIVDWLIAGEKVDRVEANFWYCNLKSRLLPNTDQNLMLSSRERVLAL